MAPDQPLPNIWLLSDARNDARLEAALKRLPRGSGFVFRHYHLDKIARRARYDTLASQARAHGHCIVLAGDPETAREWGADGVYGDAATLGADPGLLRLATVHDEHEIASADRLGVDAMFLSPVFATRSHPGAEALGTRRFLELARQAEAPVIALGGMDADRARGLGWRRWAAIDGLS